VIGTTGVGKSTFIADCTREQTPAIGHGMSSCNEGTSKISVHTMRILDRTIHLIDTPGFDDSVRSDEDTLQELAYWLVKAYERSILLSGIVLLHRITDTRLYGSAQRALDTIKVICGQEAFCGTVVATTMWDQV
ncbi:hypothetical protein EJ07DRAFT_20705, partial [Lizonia empirigonia]